MANVTCIVLKEKLASLGLTKSGTKAVLIQRLQDHLNGLKMTDLRTLCPDGLKHPATKADFISMLIMTDQPLKQTMTMMTTTTTTTTTTIVMSSEEVTSSVDLLSKQVTCAMLKDKLESLGLTKSGTKPILIKRLEDYLSGLKMADLRDLCPEGVQKPKDKESLVSLLVMIDQPFTIKSEKEVAGLKYMYVETVTSWSCQSTIVVHVKI
jgi:hypothetical protein